MAKLQRGQLIEKRPERESLLTLNRGLSILGAMAVGSATRGLDHATLARRLGFSRSTLYRYLSSLEAAGFVEQADDPTRYRLGPQILYLAAVMHRREFNSLARIYVRELAATTKATAHATVYDHPYSVTVLIEGAPAGSPVFIGTSWPVHSCASGKVYLAHALPRILEAYLASPLERRTAVTITDPAALRRLLCEVRESGYAVDQGEAYDGICGLAAPVFDISEEVVGTLSLTVATTHLEPRQIQELSPPLCDSARELSIRLGYTALASSKTQRYPKE